MKNFRVKRAAVLLTAIALLLAAAVGGTVAYLVASTGSVVNTFTPTKADIEVDEEDWNGKVKKNVQVINKGNVSVYIRAKVAFSWKDKAGIEGKVYSDYPEEGVDYTITWGGGNWFKSSDGFWYYKLPVEPSKPTSYLITNCAPVAGKAPEGYYLDVDILAQAIQAVPTTAVEQAWGVTVTDGKISK